FWGGGKACAGGGGGEYAAAGCGGGGGVHIPDCLKEREEVGSAHPTVKHRDVLSVCYDELVEVDATSMIRSATVYDVPRVQEIINSHAELGRMLFKSLAQLYEDL